MEDSLVGIKITLSRGWAWKHEAYDGVTIADGRVLIYPANNSETLIELGSKKAGLPKITSVMEKVLAANKVPFNAGRERSGNYDYTTYEFASDIRSRSFKVKYYLLSRNGKTYIFGIISSDDLYDEHLKDFQGMLATLEIRETK